VDDAPFRNPGPYPEGFDVTNAAALDVPLRVLLVEDCPELRELLRLLVGSWGHPVAAAKDGPAALDAATRFRPDLVLTDIDLPGADGYDMARRMRRLSGLADAAFVALTGRARDCDRERSMREGFLFHLVKPFDPSDLRELLAAAGRARDADAPPAQVGR
jgi:two-component system, chemotaxis family, CheB/CheR fusion protein